MMTWVEVAKAACLKACSKDWEKAFSNEFMFAVARLFAREAVEKVYINAAKILKGGQQAPDELAEKLNSLALDEVFEGALTDMDLVARELVG
jgi:hypothetical protein